MGMGNEDALYFSKIFSRKRVRDGTGVYEQCLVNEKTRRPMSADIIAGTAQDFYVHDVILRDGLQNCQDIVFDPVKQHNWATGHILATIT